MYIFHTIVLFSWEDDQICLQNTFCWGYSFNDKVLRAYTQSSMGVEYGNNALSIGFFNKSSVNLYP